VGVGYLYDETGNIRKGIKVLKISKKIGDTGYLPTDKQAVDSGVYPVSRALYQATAGKPSPEAAAFIAWEAGPEGQKIVEREGFFAISEAHKAQIAKNLN
jgi:phosphate transport system substrate-binding protein